MSNLMVYVVSYLTESGDRGIAAVYTQEPNKRQLATLMRKNFPEEVVDGVSYVRFEGDWEVLHTSLPEESEPLESI